MEGGGYAQRVQRFVGKALERPWFELCGSFLSYAQFGLENNPFTLQLGSPFLALKVCLGRCMVTGQE